MADRTEDWCLRRVRKNLRRLREEAGMWQHDLAVEAELSRAYIGRIETKGGNVKVETIQALSEALDVEPTEFFKPLDESD